MKYFILAYLSFLEKVHSWTAKKLGYKPYKEMQGDLSYLRAVLNEHNLSPVYKSSKKGIEDAVKDLLHDILPVDVEYNVHVLSKQPGNIDLFIIRSTSKEN